MIRNITFLLGCSLLLGCVSSNSTSEEDAVTSMARVKNYNGLIDHYKEELRGNPKDYAAMSALAQAYYSKGDYESAKFYADFLISEGKKDSHILQLRGLIYDEEGDIESAISSYKESIKQGNVSSDIRVYLGIAYSKADRFNDAVSEFNAARLKGHDDLVIKNNLAVVYLAQRRYIDVVVMLGPIYEQNPTNKKVKANLAIALFKLGRVEQAENLFEDEFSDIQLAVISRDLYDVGR